MNQHTILFYVFLYLVAAVISVPIAKRLGLGSVLGYLFAGVALGPFGFAFLGEGSEDVLHFAEYGVVMMLFLIGLELKPSLLWKLRLPILGLGGLQVVLFILIFTLGAMAFGMVWQEALAIGMTLSLSSTAIVLQTLNEKGLMKTEGGKGSFSVLLFQDIAVIPMLALLPLLATHHADHGGSHDGHGETWMATLPGWAEPVVVLLAILTVVFGGRFLMRPIFRGIAATGLREIFTATTLLLVVAVTLIMQTVGLSPALGAFLAGVVLAESEYRQELETGLDPFKGLFLGLFFISVGATMDFRILAESPVEIGMIILALVLLKGVLLFILGTVFKLPMSDRFLFTLGLAGGGEFAFVLFSFCVSNGILETVISDKYTLAVAISMAITPILFVFKEKVIDKMIIRAENKEIKQDDIEEESEIIICGFGRVGNIVVRMLNAFDIKSTVLELNPERVEFIRKLGMKVYFGDASRLDLLRAAGVERAKLLILALDDHEKTMEIVELAKNYFPQVKLLIRVFGRSMAWELIADHGMKNIYRETVDTSLEMAMDALKEMGIGSYEAKRAAQEFKKYDEHSVWEMAKVHKDRKAMFLRAKEIIGEIEQNMKNERGLPGLEGAWDTSTLKNEVGKKVRGADGKDLPK